MSERSQVKGTQEEAETWIPEIEITASFPEETFPLLAVNNNINCDNSFACCYHIFEKHSGVYALPSITLIVECFECLCVS